MYEISEDINGTSVGNQTIGTLWISTRRISNALVVLIVNRNKINSLSAVLIGVGESK